MNLLPKSHTEFSSQEYWESFFKKRGKKVFEWYGEYATLCGILHKYIKQKDNTLIVGCGNSRLSADLYDVGYRQTVSIDISDVAIRQMTEQNSRDRPDLKFVKMDMLDMAFPVAEFSVVLDKGTLDAIMTDSAEETMILVDKMFGEIDRVLRIGGRYVCISLAQEHILNKITQYFVERGWMLRVCRVAYQDEELEHQMPVFVFICTKFKKMPNMPPILEICQFEDKVERLSSLPDLVSSVKAMQYYGVVRQRLNQNMSVDDQVTLELFGTTSTVVPRYTLHIVDSAQNRKNKFAVFIVPEGREMEWQFNSDEGRLQVADSAKFQRLIVVALSYDHKYENLDEVKAELSTKVMDLAPPGLQDKSGKLPQVPFLTVGGDINLRHVLSEGESSLSGRYVVQDVKCDHLTFRRLVFLSSRRIIQTEARHRVAAPSASRRNKSKRPTAPSGVIDHSYISSYLEVATAGMSLVDELQTVLETELDFLLLGLGGGVYATFLCKYFKKINVEAVELDGDIVSVARDWFELTTSEKLTVVVDDALSHVEKLVETGVRKHVVLVNIDNKDSSEGLTGPAKSFLTQSFLENVHKILLPSGVLMLNLVCRNIELEKIILSEVRQVFPTLLRCKLEDDVNQILFGIPANRANPVHLNTENETLPSNVKEHLKFLNSALKANCAQDHVPHLVQKLNDIDLVT